LVYFYKKGEPLSTELLFAPKSLFLNKDSLLNFPLKKGSCEKIKWRHQKASFVARGRVKFRPPKPGGRWIAEKHFPDFRQATPATWQYLNKNQRIPASGSVG
jgi:hypothetical protein